MSAGSRRLQQMRFHIVIATILVVAGTVLLWYFLSRHNTWPHWLGCWFVAINAVSFGYYGYDKNRARAGAQRIPEYLLHGLTAAGGSLGSYLGMRFFRHKTVKGKFRIVFWCIVVIQVLLILLIIQRVWFR